MKTSKYFTDNVIIICAVCVAMSFLSQVFRINSIVNLIYAFTLLLIFGSYFLGNYISRTMIFLIIMMGISAVASGFPRRNLSDYFSHILILVCTYICIEVGSVVKIEKKTFKTIAYIFLATGLVLLVSYYFGPLKSSYFEGTDSICLNLANPNATGLWLTCIFILIAYASFLFKGLLKAVFLLVAAGLLPIITATQSRNSYLACVLFIAAVVASKIFGIKKVPKWFLKVIACLPIVVFFFYMFVIVKNMEFWESIFTIGDKGIGSRASIWQGVLDNFWNNFMFGNYPKYYDSQMHNSLITIYCRFGALSTIAVCVLLYKALEKLHDNNSFYGVISLSAIFFTGCFEASLFIGIAGLYLMLLIIPSCASVETGRVTETEESDIQTAQYTVCSENKYKRY